MPKVTFTLDGKQAEAEAGSTILEAAERQGVIVPTLCHDPRLKPTAACRVCLVEVERARGPMPACTTPLTEGMVIKTQSEDITCMRQMALELLLSDHYGDCIAPCKLACPAGIDIQGYIALVANGEYQAALKLIKESNPLPLVCGRVCPRFCEAKCRRNLVDEPVAINMLKRFVADFDIDSGEPYVPEIKPATGHKVAIVGGGPAGLSAAYYLAREGHEVTIFDASPKLGGMLRYGIPEYRLPKATLDKEIAGITGLCKTVNTDTALGKDFTIESLKSEGYEAIFVALGAWTNQTMKIEGEDLPGVLSGIGFLNDVSQAKKVALGAKVAVIGGGNTAIDAARTALRLGAKEVVIVYRRSREEMPAHDEEIAQAEEEGIQIQFLTAPVKITGENGKVSAMECIRMALGEPDSSGRRRPEPIAGSEFVMKVNNVIIAVGQRVNTGSFNHESPLALTKRGGVDINSETMTTSIEGVFAGGDCASGPATAVEAIGAGHRAAHAINRYLNGQPVTPEIKPYNCSRGELEDIDVSDYEKEERIPRAEMPSLEPEERKQNFAEIELGLDEAAALKEAGRCLACGCQDIFECQLRKLATDYGVDDSHYVGLKRHLAVHEAEHPYILRDPNKCILCGRCVRICDEVMGIGAFGFTSRGFSTRVEPALSMPLCETNCESCGQCVSTCPTGALTPKAMLPKQGPWELETVGTVCPYCGVGCRLELSTVGDKIAEITSPLNSPVNNGNLCKQGAYKPLSLHRQDRLRTPLIKKDGELTEANWEEALKLAGEGLKQIRDRAGGDALAVLSSPELTNEENYLAQKLARMALSTNNIGSLGISPVGEELARSFGKNASTCTYDDILKSDLILLYDCDLAENYPIISLKVRQAVSQGSRVIALSRRATRTDALVDIMIKVNARTSVGLLRAMLNYIISYDLVDEGFVRTRTAGFDALAKEMSEYPLEAISDQLWIKPAKVIEAIHLYIRARRPVIITNLETIRPAEMALLNNLALITGNIGQTGAGIIVMQAAGNAQGLIDMGVSPDYLPGQQPLADKAVRKSFEAAWSRSLPIEAGRDALGIVHGLESGSIPGLVVLGREASGKLGSAIFEVPLFSVLLDTMEPENPPYPDVILPVANFAESEGTYTNCERRIQELNRALKPPAGKENWKIIAALSNALGYPMRYRTVSGIGREIGRLVPTYDIFKGGRDSGRGKPWSFLKDGRFSLNNGLARLRLVESEEYDILEALATLS